MEIATPFMVTLQKRVVAKMRSSSITYAPELTQRMRGSLRPLPDTCLAAVSANPELWIEVSVAAIPLGRTKLGAVPYAVEAGHALKADVAAHAAESDNASGPLDTRVSALENAIKPKSAARWHKTKPDVWGGVSAGAITKMPTSGNYAMMFDARDFDVQGELQSDASTFKVVEAGYYMATCGAVVEGGASGLYIEASNQAMTDSEVVAATYAFERYANVTAVFSLAAGGTIRCIVVNYTGQDRSIAVWYGYEQTSNFISVARLYP